MPLTTSPLEADVCAHILVYSEESVLYTSLCFDLFLSSPGASYSSLWEPIPREEALAGGRVWWSLGRQ